MKWVVKHDRAKKVIDRFLDNAGYWQESEALYPPLCWIILWTVRFRNHAVILSEEIKNWKNYIPCLRKNVMFFFVESPESEKVNLPKPTQSST